MDRAMDRLTLDLTPLRLANASLDDALAVVADLPWFSQQSQVVQNTLIAGVVQNFKFVFELSVKMLRRRLELDSDLPGEVERMNYPDLLRTAGEKGLIANVQ